MRTRWTFTVPPYGAEFVLMRSTPAEFVRVIRCSDKNYTEDPPNGLGRTRLAHNVVGHRATLYVWVSDLYRRSPYWRSIVSHECLHAALFLLDDIGVNCRTSDADEALCYLQSWMVEQCLRRLDPPRRKA